MSAGRQDICMATDVSFWLASTGAEQRMMALVEYLSRPPFELSVFFLGQVGPDDLPRIDKLPCKVVFFESERPPDAFLQRLRWYAQATKNQIEKWLRRDGQSRTETTPPAPLKLDDYRWPWAIEQFRAHLKRTKPKAIICQYVTMGYLLEALNPVERRNTLCMIDTHDVLHERGLQFSSAGYLHWLEISREEEIDVWNKFDVVIAIQPQEAEVIQGLVTKPRVIVVGHAMRPNNSLAYKPHKKSDNAITIGYIGSANFSNWHAINRFLIEVWPELLQLENVKVELVIAGRICDWLRLADNLRRGDQFMNRVRLIGTIEELGEFYSQIDLTINPVQFGTGLKIKNIESLAFGVPLVTTASGAVGMSEPSLKGCRIVEDLSAMAASLVELCTEPAARRELGETARRLAKTEFSEEIAFSELSKLLKNLA